MSFATGLVNRLSQGIDNRIQDKRQQQLQQRQFETQMQQQKAMLPLQLEQQQALFEQQQKQQAQAFPQTLEFEKARIKMKYDLEKTLTEGVAKNVSTDVLDAFKNHDIESMLSLAKTPQDQKFVDRAYKLVFSHAQRMEELKGMRKRDQAPKSKRDKSIVDGVLTEKEPRRMSDIPLAMQEKIKTFNSQIRRVQSNIEKARIRLAEIERASDTISGALSPEEESALIKDASAILKMIENYELELRELNRKRDVAAGRSSGTITDEEKASAYSQRLPETETEIESKPTSKPSDLKSIADLSAERNRQLIGSKSGDPKKAISIKELTSMLEKINRRLSE